MTWISRCSWNRFAWTQGTTHCCPTHQQTFNLPYIQRALNDGPFFSARVGAPNPSQLPSGKYQVPHRTPRIRAKHRSGLPHRFHRLGFAGPHHKHSNVRPVPCPPSLVLCCRQSTFEPPRLCPDPRASDELRGICSDRCSSSCSRHSVEPDMTRPEPWIS